MTEAEQREAARKFASKWRNGGDEMKDCHPFWIELLQNVLGVENVTEYINFEKSVKVPEGDGKIHSRRIDGYIPAVKVLIEQKGSTHPLDEKEPQSGGEMLTPYEQGKRYNDNLPYEEKARWIVTCNFTDLWIYDMNEVVPTPLKIAVVDLQTKYPQLDFLVKKEVKKVSPEIEVSVKAGEIVGLIYDALLKQYGVPETSPKGETEDERKKRTQKLRSLNALCVRLVFLFYSEDSGIFEHNQFHDYLEPYPASECRKALKELFRVLDQKPEERDEYLEPNLAAFPYVNGGLFSDENVIIPPITEEIKTLLLDRASAGFDWKDISPTIFGAVFESTLNPETRRSNGMHYTSLDNIHKVIDPLFLDDLKAEFQQIKAIQVTKTRNQKLRNFQNKLASLEFLDPAAGSGNFLTESYISIRRLENEVIRELSNGQISFGSEEFEDPIKVSIHQFYGIEINDFAVTVAKTALWIAENQMLDETKDILYGFQQDFLPLKSYANITEGNALRIDWEKVVPKETLSFIMGNPPFVGYSLQSAAQKADLEYLLPDVGKNIDYVMAWYFKAADLMNGTNIRTAFVSTNSICQGEQVSVGWKPLFEKYNIHIDFAYRTFIWDSEASIKAHVHCVIVGFSTCENSNPRKIYDTDGKANYVHNINAYLLDGPNVFIESRKHSLGNVPEIIKGSSPVDGGGFFINDEEKEIIEKSDKIAAKYIRRFYGAREYIHNEDRWCLWLVKSSPEDVSKSKILSAHVEKVRNFRLSSNKAATRRYADYPTRFMEIRQPETNYILVPRHSSQNRRYVPFGFMSPDVICGDANNMVPNATLFHFGVLISNVHMSWMRAVCGRIKSDYRYSNDIVYNNFPWPTPTEEQKKGIIATAQGILDARALYPDSSLASLYDPLTMPPELRKAHTANDRAVMAAYGFTTKMSEADCVARLMEMYKELVNNSAASGKKG